MSRIGFPVPAHWEMAFGWFITEEADEFEPSEKKWILFNNIINVVSYVLSPLIGIIRIIVNAYFLAKNKNQQGSAWDNYEKTYFKVQIGRGVAELFGAGLLMWIPDLIATIHMYKVNAKE
jgi:hypothetical protein